MAKILISYRVAPRIRTWETGSMVARAFRALGHEVDEYAKEYQAGRWLCKTPFGLDLLLEPSLLLPDTKLSFIPENVFMREYDLVLNMECNDPDPQYFELIGVKAKKRAVYHFDTSYYMDVASHHISQYHPDHVFYANSKLVWNTKNTSWLPYAADSKLHVRSPSHAKLYDVALVGSDRPDRRRLIAILQEAGIDARLISDVFKEDYVEALASAKIVLNQNPSDGSGLLNMRYFETLAAGSMLLNNAGDGDELTGLIPGIHFVRYASEADLVEKAIYYIRDHAERIKVSCAGHQAFLEGHTYEHRAQEIMDVIGL